MRTRVLVLCVGLALSSTQAFSQIIACSNMVGNWEDIYDNTTYQLNQDSGGNLSGEETVPYCQGNQQWPIKGTINGGYFNFVATNNGCTNSTVASVTYTGNVGQPGCNYASGSWMNSAGNSGPWGDSNPYPSTLDYVTKPVDVPKSETSVTPTGAQWDTSKAAPWNQTLAPNTPPGEFEGRGVYEYAAIGPGNDTCWFKGSTIPIFDSVTTPGFAWTVSSQNSWGADFIGWNLVAVRYYRKKKRVPCSSTFQQQMVIDAAFSPNNPSNYGQYTNNSGGTFYGVPYEINTLGAGITATTATSVRNGQTSTNTTWK